METQFGFEPYVESTLRDKLKEELACRQLRNSNYSLRALARDLGVSHPALSEFLHGRRKFSVKMAESVAAKLSLNSKDQDKLKSSQAHNPLNFVKMTNDEISLSREWYIGALSELVKVKNFSGDPKWIAKALHVEEEKIEKAIGDLQKLGWIEIDNSGTWRVKEENTTTLGNITAKADIYRVLSQYTDLQQDTIQRQIPEESSIAGITFAIDPEDLPKARKLVYEFISNMSELLERKTAEKKEVYRMNVALFPVSSAEEV